MKTHLVKLDRTNRWWHMRHFHLDRTGVLLRIGCYLLIVWWADGSIAGWFRH